MAVRVDEAGNDDPIRCIDDCRGIARGRYIGPNFADFAVLDEHIGLGEVADLPIEGENNSTLQ